MRNFPAGSEGIGGDAAVAAVAGAQHGVVTVAQLMSAGLTRNGVLRRTRAGRLHRIHRGVYAVGHTALGDEGRWMAGVLATGARAILGHRSSAELWRMLAPAGGPVHVVIPWTGGRTKRPGLVIHYTTSLPEGDVTTRLGIPVTTPSRTLADLARTASRTDQARALRNAEFLGYPISLPGDRRPERTRTELERRFLALCRRHRIPLPEVNVVVAGIEVDFLWPERRLIVEVDGWQAHRGRWSFEADRRRDVDLRLAGYEVVRFTYRAIFDEPAWVIERLQRLLALR